MMMMVKYTCKRCGAMSTRIRPHAAGGKAPRLCDECAMDLCRAQARERYHNLERRGAVHVKNNKIKG
jgi:hypothetical protein